jgi:hypothetical protein
MNERIERDKKMQCGEKNLTINSGSKTVIL